MGMIVAAAIGLTAWVVPWDGPELPTGLDSFQEVHPFALALDGVSDPHAVVAYPDLLARSAALRSGGRRVVPVIVNDILTGDKVTQFKSGRALEALLRDPRKAAAHQEELLRLAEGFDGLELDYERVPDGLWGRYLDFIEKLAFALHARRQVLYVDLEPRQVYDAEWTARVAPALRASVDGANLMAYYGKGGFAFFAGAANSRAYVEETARRGLAALGPEKLIVCLTLAGTDWTAAWPLPLTPWRGQRLHYREVQERLAAAKPRFDEASATPWFEDRADGKRHQVWYEDERSLQAKLDALSKLGVKQVGFWYWGSQHPKLTNRKQDRPILPTFYSRHMEQGSERTYPTRTREEQP